MGCGSLLEFVESFRERGGGLPTTGGASAAWRCINICSVPAHRATSKLTSWQLRLHTSPLVQTPALRAVGNIVTGDDNQTQVELPVLSCQMLPDVARLRVTSTGDPAKRGTAIAPEASVSCEEGGGLSELGELALT